MFEWFDPFGKKREADILLRNEAERMEKLVREQKAEADREFQAELDLAKKKREEKEEEELRIHNTVMEKTHPCPSEEEHCWHPSSNDYGSDYTSYCCNCGGEMEEYAGKVLSITLQDEHGEFLKVTNEKKKKKLLP